MRGRHSTRCLHSRDTSRTPQDTNPSVEPDRPTTPLIEITPEMIEAGLSFLYRFHHEGDEREIVSEIYRAMVRAKEISHL